MRKTKRAISLFSSDTIEEMALTMKRKPAKLGASFQMNVEMALVVVFLIASVAKGASHSNGEMLLSNVTRFAAGDLFSLVGRYKNSDY